jgi:hypothetical protein
MRARDEDAISPGAGCAYLLALIPLGIWQAYALTILWGWFVQPLGAPALTVPRALGLTVTVAVLRGKAAGVPTSSKASEMSNADLLRIAVTWPLTVAIALGMGWVYRHFL